MKIPTIFLSCALLVARLSPTTSAVTSPSLTAASKARRAVRDLPTANLSRESKKALEDARGGGGVPPPIQRMAYAGVVAMAVLERTVNYIFQQQGIKFPALLGGCIFLFTFMLAAEGISEGAGEKILMHLAPGSALLAKWLPVFFVPGLAMLPLAPSVGSGMEIAKVLLVTALGFVYSMATVSIAVVLLRGMQGSLIKEEAVVNEIKQTAGPPPKAFSADMMNKMLTATALSGALSIGLTKRYPKSALQTPLQTVFWLIATFATYVWGARLPAGFTKIIHPLIISTLLTLGTVRLTGMATGVEFLDAVRMYKASTLDLRKTGAGDILLFMLGPTVVSFANSMFSRRKLLKDNFFIVITAILVSSFGGLFGTAAFVKAIQLGGMAAASRLVRLSVLARNVTTALAIPITNMLGGDVSIAASVVVLTGIIGATYGRSLATAMGVTDPVARGLAVGSAGQGMGVASLVSEPDAFPFGAVAMVLTAVCSTIIVSIPSARNAIIATAVVTTKESLKKAVA